MSERDALREAIEGLYEVFARYPLRPHVDGCAHCIMEEDHARLHSRPLRDLTTDDLDRYAFKAMTTWGDVDDFRHYLPRLFELLAFDQNLMCDAEILLGKLGYAGWCHWPEDEQVSVLAYLTTLWRYVLACCPFTSASHWGAEECLCGIAHAGADLTPFLREWRTNRQVSACCHLAQLIGCDGYEVEIEDSFGPFWQEYEVEIEQVVQWLREPATLEMIEAGLELAPSELVSTLSEARERLVQWQGRGTQQQSNQ